MQLQILKPPQNCLCGGFLFVFADSFYYIIKITLIYLVRDIAIFCLLVYFKSLYSLSNSKAAPNPNSVPLTTALR